MNTPGMLEILHGQKQTADLEDKKTLNATQFQLNSNFVNFIKHGWMTHDIIQLLPPHTTHFILNVKVYIRTKVR